MGYGKVTWCCLQNKVEGNLVAMQEIWEQETTNQRGKVR